MAIEAEDAIQPPYGSVLLKQEVWKLKIAPKIQHFLWRGLSKAVPTAIQLRSRTIPVEPLCQRCCIGDETINHILFTCPYAQTIWRCATTSIGHTLIFSDNFEDNIHIILRLQGHQTFNKTSRLTPWWLIWRIWKSRNEFLFQKINREPVYVWKKCLTEVNEWVEADQEDMEDQETQINRPLKSQNENWIPPPEGWVKCNFDSGFAKDRIMTNSGWIIRDCYGQMVLSGCAQLQSAQTALQAEALGFLHALQVCWTYGLRYVWFEGDNMELTNLINKVQDHQNLGTLLYDIRFWMAKLPLSSLAHVHREKNKSEDRLAYYALTMDTLYESFSTPPFWLVDTL